MHGLFPQSSFSAWMSSPVWSHIFRPEQLTQMEVLLLSSYIIPSLDEQRRCGFGRHLVWAIAWLLFLVDRRVVQLAATPVYDLSKLFPESGNLNDFISKHKSEMMNQDARMLRINEAKLKQLKSLIPMVDVAIARQIDIQVCAPVKPKWDYKQTPLSGAHPMDSADEIPSLGVWLDRLKFPSSLCSNDDLDKIHQNMHQFWTLASKLYRSKSNADYFKQLLRQ
jgi:hypothetical protein